LQGPDDGSVNPQGGGKNQDTGQKNNTENDIPDHLQGGKYFIQIAGRAHNPIIFGNISENNHFFPGKGFSWIFPDIDSFSIFLFTNIPDKIPAVPVLGIIIIARHKRMDNDVAQGIMDVCIAGLSKGQA